MSANPRDLVSAAVQFALQFAPFLAPKNLSVFAIIVMTWQLRNVRSCCHRARAAATVPAKTTMISTFEASLSYNKWFIFISSSCQGAGWWWLLCAAECTRRRLRDVKLALADDGREGKLFDDCQRRFRLFEFKFLYAFIGVDRRGRHKEEKSRKSFDLMQTATIFFNSAYLFSFSSSPARPKV